MVSLHVLTADEAKALASEDSDPGGNSIVSSGPWIKGNGELAHRIVIRDLPGCVVVHSQVIDTSLGYAFFDQGNYFQKMYRIEWDRVWARFDTRVRRSMGIPDC